MIMDFENEVLRASDAHANAFKKHSKELTDLLGRSILWRIPVSVNKRLASDPGMPRRSVLRISKAANKKRTGTTGRIQDCHLSDSFPECPKQIGILAIFDDALRELTDVEVIGN